MIPPLRFRIPKKVVHEHFEDELVIINLDNGNYYTVDGIGADIWQEIEHGLSKAEIVARLMADHSNGSSSVEQTVERFIAELWRECLIVPNTIDDVAHSSWLQTSDVEASRDSESSMLHRYLDMQALLVLDPIHEVDESGWPSAQPQI